MDISEILSTNYTEYDIGTPLSTVAGAFENQQLDAVVVTDGESYRGVLSRRELAASSNQPSAKVGSRVQHVPTVDRTEDVREVARLMIASDAKTLPVLDGERVVGVVTADAVLEAVRGFLDAATVEEAYTAELISATPDTTVGKALHLLREGRIDHLPVLEDGDLVGMVSLYDVIDFTTRGGTKSQGGSARGGGGGGRSAGGSQGGFGAREGDTDRMLDIPVREFLSEQVATVSRDAGLDAVVGELFDREISSLVVTEGETPVGIITKTDVIESLTWEQDDQRTVQVFDLDEFEGLTRDDVSAVIESVTAKYGEMSVIKASVELNEHKEQSRGVPLVLARIRLVTDRGYFTADGEGYGAKHALRLAANAIERQVLKGKTYGQSKKHPDQAAQEQLYGWWLGA